MCGTFCYLGILSGTEKYCVEQLSPLHITSHHITCHHITVQISPHITTEHHHHRRTAETQPATTKPPPTAKGLAPTKTSVWPLHWLAFFELTFEASPPGLPWSPSAYISPREHVGCVHGLMGVKKLLRGMLFVSARMVQ